MTDVDRLARQEYASLDSLRVRIQTHHRYGEHSNDLEQSVDAAIALQPGESLLDVGCGTGFFLRRLASVHSGQLTGVDMSEAALAELADLPQVSTRVADAQALPFPDGSFDVVTARHMLYHVPDPSLAITEAYRVLRPGGRFVATVNIRSATPFIMGVLRFALLSEGVRPREQARDRVHSENLRELVAGVFAEPELRLHPNALVLPEPQPIIDYAVSCLTLAGIGPDSPERARVVDTIADLATRWFERHPGQVVRDPAGYCLVVGRRGGASR